MGGKRRKCNREKGEDEERREETEGERNWSKEGNNEEKVLEFDANTLTYPPP